MRSSSDLSWSHQHVMACGPFTRQASVATAPLVMLMLMQKSLRSITRPARTTHVASTSSTRQQLLQRVHCIPHVPARKPTDVNMPSLQFDIDALRQAASAAADDLSKECLEQPEVHITMKGLSSVPAAMSEYEEAVRCTQWLEDFCAHANRSPSRPLQRITSINLDCHVLGDIVPKALVTSCPNMRQLHRHGWLHKQEGVNSIPVPCPQLQQLSLQSVAAAGAGNNMMEQEMQQQLSSLPNLKILECSVETDRAGKVLTWLQHSIAPLRTQLEALMISAAVGRGSRDVKWHTKELLSHPWPHLKCLKLVAAPPVVFNDEELEALLHSMPDLEELEIGAFCLDNSFAHQPSSWKQLSLQYINGRELAQLPLSQLSTFKCQEVLLQQKDWQYLPAAAEAIARVPNIHGLDAANSGLWLEAYPGLERQQEGAAALVQIAQRSQVGHVELHASDGSGMVVGQEWLKLLAQLPCHTLTLDPTTIPTDCWPTLPQQLLQVQQLQLCMQQHYEEPPDTLKLSMLITALCVLAQRPLALRLEVGQQEMGGSEWQLAVQELMRGAGHQHVSIEPLQASHMLMARMPLHEAVHHVPMFA